MMTERLPATPAPGPLEEYAQAFDALFAKRNQRESFRRCLEGLLLPMERNKTLTGLANTEPVIGEEHHLGVPIVRRERPAMAEHDRLALAPVLIEYLDAVLCCDRRHDFVSLCAYAADPAFDRAST